MRLENSAIHTHLPSPNDATNNKASCPVCLESGIPPRFLPCIHVICDPCLQKLITSSEENTFKCPICRKVYPSDAFAHVGSRQYRQTAETSFSSQGNLPTISERVQSTEDRELGYRVIRDSRINQRPQTHVFYNNESECVCCRSCIKTMAFGVLMLHLNLVAIVRLFAGLILIIISAWDHWKGVGIFHTLKGLTDIIIAITLRRDVTCRYRKYLFWVLILASVIVMGFGTCSYLIWTDFIRIIMAWYTIVDWLMIFCSFWYMYVLFFINQN